MKSAAEIRTFSTPQELFHAAAEEVIETATRSIAERDRFTIALSGGSTPKSLYSLIAANASGSLPWAKIYFFFGDERHVPPTDAESNYHMARETILSKIPVPPANIFPIPAENPEASAAAGIYEQTLQKFFGLKPGEFPRFDLILLGLKEGRLKPVVAKTFPLSEIVEAHRYLESNQQLGKIVVTV